MNNYPTPDTPVRAVGLRERFEVNGHHFTRLKGIQQWTEVIPEKPPIEFKPLYLSLIHHKQGPGEPFHWSLYVTHDNEAGYEYQVTGDAECMTYEPSDGAVDHGIIAAIARHEAPPRVPNRASVKENCQGWAVRVISKLVERGIVESVKLEMARSMLQPA